MHVISEEQRKALAHLAESYFMLSSCWEPDWEGPENFGGVLDHLGVLPRASIDEAAYDLVDLLENVQVKNEDVFVAVLESHGLQRNVYICSSCLEQRTHQVISLDGPIRSHSCSFCEKVEATV